MTQPAPPPLQETVRGLIAFTDIVGFTELTAAQGDELALAIVTRQEEIVSRELPVGARIVKELGDGLLLFFPDSRIALATCLRLQDIFDRETETAELPIWVRMGLHWGNAARYRNDLIGHDVNVASRIADVAGPGEVLLSESVIHSLDGAIDHVFEEIGPVVMKGIPEPLRLFRAVRDPDPAFSLVATHG
jgi:class 3 adenylate cyclase